MKTIKIETVRMHKESIRVATETFFRATNTDWADMSERDKMDLSLSIAVSLNDSRIDEYVVKNVLETAMTDLNDENDHDYYPNYRFMQIPTRDFIKILENSGITIEKEVTV